VTYENNRASAVHNGFQISTQSSASLLGNDVEAAGTAVYLGPRAISVNLRANRISGCHTFMSGDGSGTVIGDRGPGRLLPSSAN
jgi:hypothetical protein